MAPPSQIIQWLQRNYPKPKVDPEWLEACYDWVVSTYNLNHKKPGVLDEIIKHVESQLLQSDLGDSMLRGTGLPTNLNHVKVTRLSGPPILVEITTITEIGHSAFSLQNTRQSRIDRADLNGLAEENEDEEEGPVPKYPRSMLRFTLSDGATNLSAIEYRALPGLALGVTPLGYKILLKDVLVRKGIAFLEPKCLVMKGQQTSDREATQDGDFARRLRSRLGQPEPEPQVELEAPVASGGENPAPPPLAAPQNARSPLREISEPPEPPHLGPTRANHDDDEEQPRRRKIPNPNSQPPNSSGTMVQSSYFTSPPPTAVSVLRRERLLSPVRGAPFEMDDDEMDRAIQESLAENATHNVKGRVLDYNLSSDFEDDGMVMDDSFFLELNKIEQGTQSRVASKAPVPGPSSSVPSALQTVMASSETARGVPPRSQPIDVITIDDEEEEDKENVPVPTRHIRRRTGPSLRFDDDVIDISD